MVKSIREYENLHIALWLLKDMCWVTEFRIGGMIMIIPTLFVAIHITYKSRKDIADLFHNIAICLWISANGTWMTGEFFFTDKATDTNALRPYATIFFILGIIVVAIYYAYHFPKRKSLDEHDSEVELADKPNVLLN